MQADRIAFDVPHVSAQIIDQLRSPALVIFRDRVVANIETMIRIAGNPDRLRPHCKTHKMDAVTRLLLDRGIQRHKAATIAESEMLLNAGATDVLLGYNPVGPNIDRVVQLAQKFPDRKFAVTADHPIPVDQLSRTATAADVEIGVMLDVNVGQNRTGIPVQDVAARELYGQIHRSSGLRADGFHVYDGHQRDSDLAARTAAVLNPWQFVLQLKSDCESMGVPVPAMVCGGTPTFPVYAALQEPGIQLSPGTCIFHDAGYGSHFTDLKFQPAAAVLSRVISRPGTNRATLDLGNKAVAADPPKGQRVYFPAFPDAEQDIHNEEHLVVVSPDVDDLQPGDAVWGIPVHVCPTSALYDQVFVIDDGQLVSPWMVTSRNRKLTI